MPTGGLNYPMQYQVRSEALKQKVREEKAKQIQKGQEEMAKRFGLRKLAVKTAYDMVFEQAHIGIEPVDAPFYSMKKRCTLYPYKVACQGQTVRIEVVRVRYGWMDGRFILVPQNTTKNPPTHPPTHLPKHTTALLQGADALEAAAGGAGQEDLEPDELRGQGDGERQGRGDGLQPGNDRGPGHADPSDAL